MLDEVNHELFAHCEQAADEIVGRILDALNNYFRKNPVPTSFVDEGQDYLKYLVRRVAHCGLGNVGTVEQRATDFVLKQLEELSAAERFVLYCFVIEMRERVPEDDEDDSPEANQFSNEIPDNNELAEYIVGFWQDQLFDMQDENEGWPDSRDITVTPLKLGDKCPYCGGKLLPIVYGMPGEELQQKAENGEVILGGCCLTGADPQKQCSECGFQFLEVDEKDFKD